MRGTASPTPWAPPQSAIAFVLASLLAGAESAAAQSTAPLPIDSLVVAAPAPDPASQYVDLLLSRYNGPAPSPGCAVGVIRDGALVFTNGYGFADLEHDVRVTPTTVFYLASLSKQFTAMSIVLLAQQGKLSLDDDIRMYVEEVPDFKQTITLRHLLSHTSGLRDYFALLAITGWAADEAWSEAQFLDLVHRQKGLNFPPGERFLYSNTGYALLGVVVKRVAKMPLREFAEKNIFAPLGMTSTVYRDDHRTLIRGRATAYELADGQYRTSVPGLDLVGDGGVYSTVEDIARWDANFESATVGGKEGVALLQTPGRLKNGVSTGYGLGLTMGPLGAVQAIAGSGLYGGYSSSYVRVPDQRLSVIALCNTSAAPARLADQIATVYLPLSVGTGTLPGISLPTIPPSALATRQEPERQVEPPDPAEAAWLEARYFSDELNMTVTLRPRGTTLYMDRPRGERLRFTRIGKDLYASSDQIVLSITRDRAGAVKGFTLNYGRVSGLEFLRQPF